LQTLLNNVKAQLETYKNQNGKTPASAVPFDQEYSHLIPDLRGMLSEELYSQGLRSILAGLGFVDVIQGLSNTRKESVLNPKPFLAETNNGVIGFKAMLMDVISIIVERNKKDHPKFFGDNNEIEIVNSPLKINIDGMLEYIRSGFDRGPISMRSYAETLGFSYDIERERRKKELEDGSEELMYPHLINNQEGVLDRVVPSLKKNELQDKKEVKNKNKPESNNFKANEELSLEIAPYTDENFPDYLKKYPEHARDIWIATWNTVYNETKDEAKAFKIAWSALQKYMKTLKNKKE
jgi:cation transport regulator ChaB